MTSWSEWRRMSWKMMRQGWALRPSSLASSSPVHTTRSSCSPLRSIRCWHCLQRQQQGVLQGYRAWLVVAGAWQVLGWQAWGLQVRRACLEAQQAMLGLARELLLHGSKVVLASGGPLVLVL